MKKLIITSALFIIICLALIGCDNNTRSIENTETTSVDMHTLETTDIYNLQITDHPYMMKLDGKLYKDTGETNSMLRCGTLDYNLEYSGDTDTIPTKDGTANFKADEGGGQHSWRKNRKEVCINGNWHILAYNENDIAGVSMTVKENTDTSITIEFLNNSDLDIQHGEAYTIEVKDSESGEWFTLDTVINNYAFNDLAYITQKGVPATIDIDFEWLYGKLEKGTYRIVKELNEIKPTDGFTKHWYSVEFNVN